ncbi:hypothetical protein H0H81_011067 [Sphagnurus paluster]|uniref:Uncharacterized protein n=1 Tax=Sphagnurus paluster TaxID=117069 RepID=A0A9P7GHP6_9AGAR|nr:hypothetical protein H0H81_011067 [Sphagnurus paluster]
MPDAGGPGFGNPDTCVSPREARSLSERFARLLHLVFFYPSLLPCVHARPTPLLITNEPLQSRWDGNMALLLEQFGRGLTFIGQPVHATFFPYPIAATIHAARISIAYQANSRAATAGTGTRLNWPTYLAGYLVMTWGGTIITHQLLHLPPPMLYSLNPYIIYLTTHLTLTLLTYLFPVLLSKPFLALLDTVMFPLDAIVRTGAVTGTTAHLVPGSPVPRPLASSTVTHLIIGALASAGGGLSASTLSTWAPTWSFSTPPVLRASTLSAFLWGSMDIWGGALVAAVHGVASGAQAFHGAQALVLPMLGNAKLVGEPLLAPLEAKALAAGTLAVCFGARAYKLHWAAPPPAEKKKGVKAKTQ